jgi:hypothetical protein
MRKEDTDAITGKKQGASECTSAKRTLIAITGERAAHPNAHELYR